MTKTRYTGWDLALDKGDAAVDGRGPSADYLPLVIAESAGADSAASGGSHAARAADENAGRRAGDQHLAPTSADGRAIKGGAQAPEANAARQDAAVPAGQARARSMAAPAPTAARQMADRPRAPPSPGRPAAATRRSRVARA